MSIQLSFAIDDTMKQHESVKIFLLCPRTVSSKASAANAMLRYLGSKSRNAAPSRASSGSSTFFSPKVLFYLLSISSSLPIAAIPRQASRADTATMSSSTESIGAPAVAFADSSANAPSAPSNTNPIDASGVPSTVTTDADVTVTEKVPAFDSALTGLTPDQVMQELKENGYVDQLRRRMYDAFLASEKASIGPTAVAGVAHPTSVVSGSTVPSTAPSTNNSSAPIDSQPRPTLIPSIAAPPITTTTSQATTSSSPLDIGTKPSFLTHLSILLSDHITSDHSNLRLLLPREQQNSLLNSLDSATVHHPQRNTIGDATIYELLVRHVVAGKDAMIGEEGTGGMLDKDEGWVGKEANGRVKQVIREMMARASMKGEDDEEEGDEDEDSDEEDEDGEEGQGADTPAAAAHAQVTATQPPHSSPLHPTQPSSISITSDMQQD